MQIIFTKTEKQRLDKFLTEQFAQLSRSYWQKEIKKRNILVNQQTVTPHHFLKNGDTIDIDVAPEKITTPKIWPLKIVAESDNFLIINKPAGLTVHRTHNHSTEYTLADMLLARWPILKSVGENQLRPGIVHRLDKEVSGVMIIAKNNTTFWHLKKQFKDRQIKKIYLGLVYGQMPDLSGKIDFKITRSSRSGKMVARPSNQIGKEALTEYEVIKSNQHYSYLKITPHTGRTHQIRLHLAALGHPLVGEYLHIPKKLKRFKNIDRIFLHAYSLGFYDLTNNWQEYKVPLPTNLKKILNSLL